MLSLTAPEPTWLHRLPAGPKLAVLAVAVTLLVPVERPGVLAGAVAAVALLHLSAGWRLAGAGLAALVPLVPFLALALAWHAVAGTPAAGLAVALRLLAAVGLANLVTMTTPLGAMCRIADRLAAPLARLVPAFRATGLAIALAVRFTPVLIRRGHELAEAWRARSPRRPGLALLPPLMMAALDDADHVAEALRARGGVPADRETR